MSKELLIIVDMQNDFINGVFGTPEARAIVNPMVEFIKSFDGDILFTKDYHIYSNHPITDKNFKTSTREEIRLLHHCEIGTKGQQIIPELQPFVVENNIYWISSQETLKKENVLNKFTFGAKYSPWISKYDRICFCGVCTDICVLSNVINVQTVNPFAELVVFEDLCAGSTPEKHKMALDVMNNLLVVIENAADFNPQLDALE